MYDVPPAEIQEAFISLSDAELFQAQTQIISLLHKNQEFLEEIRCSEASIFIRWADLLAILLPIQVDVMTQMGYNHGYRNLSYFNRQLQAAMQSNEDLKVQNEGKWVYVMETAFGITSFRELTLNEAIQIVDDLCTLIESKQFIISVDETMQSLPEEASIHERRTKLLEILLSAHLQVLEPYGFTGELGFVEAQRALMPHVSDLGFVHKVSYAQAALFQRAGLL